MKRALSLAAALGLGLVLTAMTFPKVGQSILATAGSRPPNEFQLMTRLNGSPTRIGVITSTGASTTNVSTASAFTITGSTVIDILCDAAAFCIEGATASATYTASTMGVPQGAGVERFYVSKTTTATATFACFGAAAFNCAVFEMQ